MIWPLLQMFLVIALVTTIASFHTQIEELGQAFLKLMSATLWFASGLAMFKIRFHSGGSVAMVFWDFTLGSNATAPGIVWIFYAFGSLLLVFGLVQAWMIVTRGNVQAIQELTGKKGSELITDF